MNLTKWSRETFGEWVVAPVPSAILHGVLTALPAWIVWKLLAPLAGALVAVGVCLAYVVRECHQKKPDPWDLVGPIFVAVVAGYLL